MISMKDISERCGVSIATVSKALNNRSDISAPTRELICNTAREMGYFPNSSARALKTNRTYNLGVLFVDAARSGLKHNYFSQVLDSFKVTTEANGYDITFINVNQEFHPMTYLEHSRYRGIDGAVIACVDFKDPQVADLIESDIPVVTIDCDHPHASSVISDNITGMRQLTDYICDSGHRKIAYIFGDDNDVTKNRMEGFRESLSAHRISLSPEYLLRGKYRDPESAYQHTKELLSAGQPPTCIAYPDDYAMIGGLNAVFDLNLSIPGDVSIAGYDGLNYTTVFRPPLTTLKQDTEAIGQKAALELIAQVESPHRRTYNRIVVKGRLLEGASVKKLF
ncbi:MAG: LacI family transcriptional regulator [Lachnospiraceae bacterium]|nr:LacI family transcriptional regulator [Lachnospiraceae bacterium]